MSNNEADDARWLYEHRDELEGEDVEFEVAKPLTVTFAFRLPQDEADAVRRAADEKGISVSQFVRQACRLRVEQQEYSGATEGIMLPHLRSMVAASESITRHIRQVADELGEPFTHMIDR